MPCAEPLPPSGPEPGDDATAAALGAQEGGFRSGPAPEGWLQPLLDACLPETVHLSPGLARWAPAIRARGSRVTFLEPSPAAPAPGDQVWLDLGGGDPGGPGPDHLEAWLAGLGQGAAPPLVVLLRDDHPARPRTQRLAVDRPGRTLLLRETAGGTGGYALGRPELLDRLDRAASWGEYPTRTVTTPIPLGVRPESRLLVLDVDGVLIEPGRAFMEAVAGALADLAPGLAWDDHAYRSLKRAGGFNNDFRLAAGALALAERNLTPAASGIPWPDLEARIRALEPQCRLAVRRHYARTRGLERPLVRLEQLDGGIGDMAVFTGRPPEELAHAFGVLGRVLPGLGDSAPHLRKPRPEGLIQLADAFRAERILFVGDSRDDAAALRAARDLRPELRWTFAAVGPDRDRFAGPGDLRAASLLDLLADGGLP
jgi:phosphoglycolate phosphatase-like HAD superfamily hydrolase